MNSRFFSSRMDVLILVPLWAESQIVHEEADQSANHGDVAKPLQRPLPKLDCPRDTRVLRQAAVKFRLRGIMRSEEHTSELQSHLNLVCRLLLEKKKNTHSYKQPDTKLSSPPAPPAP